MRTGRPSKFTAEVRERILQGLSVGVPLESSARAAGVSYSAFRQWIRRGERGTKGEYADFVRAVREAEGRALLKWLAIIDKAAADGDWRAAAWKAQMCRPELFGTRHQVEVTGRDGRPIEQSLKSETKLITDPERQAKILEILIEAGAIQIPPVSPPTAAKDPPPEGSNVPAGQAP